MGLQGRTLDILASSVEDMTDFRRSNLTGERGPALGGLTSDHPGRLPHDLGRVFSGYVNDGSLEYVVRSYATPIAWKVRGMTNWIFPGETYSKSTNGHQSALRLALSRL